MRPLEAAAWILTLVPAVGAIVAGLVRLFR
jgi:hypothetical protein